MGLRLMQQESLMKEQGMRIERIHQEEFSLQSKAVVGEVEGTVASIPGSEGRITQAWVDVQGGMRVTPWNEAVLEAVLKRARVTKHSWLMACDANMSPAEFEKYIRFQRNRMHVVPPKEASTCRSNGAKGELGLKELVTACKSLKQKISQMEVVEDFGPCLLWQKEKRSYRKTSAHEEAKTTAQRTVGQSLMRSWDTSQIENEEEEEEKLWQNENQMEMQWVEDGKLEEFLGQRRTERSSLQAKLLQKAPELLVHERMSQVEGLKVKEEKKKVK